MKNDMILTTKIMKFIAGMALALSVTACATPQKVSRNAVYEAPATAVQAEAIQAEKETYQVTQLNLTIPEELTVSEANVYKPRADIVWREDPLGDRKQQIQKIMSEALTSGVSKVTTGRQVTMDVRLNQFHALSQKTRYTVGGRHEINFDYILRDATTGLAIADAKNIDTSFKAFGGSRAIEAMSRGETQKVRITRHIENLIYSEMTGMPEA